MPGSTGRPALACVLALLGVLGTGLAPAALAHNPADAVYHPVEVEDRWLVAGGEGTWAFLDEEGTAILRGNISGQREILAAPVSNGDQAAAIVRSYPSLEPELQAFERAGPTWNATVGEPEDAGYVLASDDGFDVFLRSGRLVEVSSEGDLTRETQLEVKPRAAPAEAHEGTWLGTTDGLVLLNGTAVIDEAPYTGRPTDVAVTDDHVLVSLAHTGERKATLMAFDRSLELDWSRSLPGLRLGGSPATLPGSYVVSTYNPEGARVVSLDPADGTVQWNRDLANTTAAAPTALEDRIVLATTDHLAALGPNGSLLWRIDAKPYLASPATTGDLVTPTGRDNRLVAVHPNGAVAWTWTDGVEMPGWVSHHGSSQADSQGPTQASETGWLGYGLDRWLAAAAAVAVAAAIGIEVYERKD